MALSLMRAWPAPCSAWLTELTGIVPLASRAGHQGFADHWNRVAEPVARARRWSLRHRRDLLAAAR